MKLKKSNCDETPQLSYDETKNSNCDKIQNIKLL